MRGRPACDTTPASKTEQCADLNGPHIRRIISSIRACFWSPGGRMRILSIAAITALSFLVPSYGAETKLSNSGTSSGAAYPKGSYSALNKLPDWGGVWVLKFRPPGTR